MTEPIATIEFERDGQRYQAVLPNDLRWRVPADPKLAETLNEMFPTDASPSRGIPGHEAATKAAVWLGGVLTFTPREPAPPGVDY
jgi:hypothetical protein